MVAFVVALSIIVAIHEYGHYIVGRWCGIKAEVFSLGFGPVLISKTDRYGTKWQIAALPFGGYVKFLGDADAASASSDDVSEEVDPRTTMHGAPIWARSLTVLAGPVFNFVLTILIFAGVQMNEGRSVVPLAYDGARVTLPNTPNDLQSGDVFVAVEGISFDSGNLGDQLPFEKSLIYTVLRGDEQLDVVGPYLMPPAVTGITPRSAADDAGLRKGDVISGINGSDIFAFGEIIAAVENADGGQLDLTVLRDDEVIDMTLAPRRVDLPNAQGGFDTRWLIGISGGFFFDDLRESIGPWEATKNASRQLWFVMRSSVSGLWHMATGAISSCNLSGPVGIAQTSGTMAAQGGTSFIWFVGMLSAAVGLLNLFPVPILDGGHLVFHAYEAVFRKKPSHQVSNVLMMMGLTMILMLMSFAMLNDLVLCP